MPTAAFVEIVKVDPKTGLSNSGTNGNVVRTFRAFFKK
jgi:hypothetical protein